MPRELSELVGSAERSHHSATVHVRTFIVMVVSSFAFQLLVHAATHRMLPSIVCKLHVVDATMCVHVRLLVHFCCCLAVGHAR